MDKCEIRRGKEAYILGLMDHSNPFSEGWMMKRCAWWDGAGHTQTWRPFDAINATSSSRRGVQLIAFGDWLMAWLKPLTAGTWTTSRFIQWNTLHSNSHFIATFIWHVCSIYLNMRNFGNNTRFLVTFSEINCTKYQMTIFKMCLNLVSTNVGGGVLVWAKKKFWIVRITDIAIARLKGMVHIPVNMLYMAIRFLPHRTLMVQR